MGQKQTLEERTATSAQCEFRTKAGSTQGEAQAKSIPQAGATLRRPRAKE
jgi:hypothetical protein